MLKIGMLSVVLLLSINAYTMEAPNPNYSAKSDVSRLLPSDNPLHPDQLDEFEQRMEVEDLINIHFKENPEENTAENFQYYVTSVLNYLKVTKSQLMILGY